MTKNKKITSIVLAGILAIILTIILVIILIPKEINQNNYFNSLVNSKYTKLVQTTSITEENIEAYKKVETLVIQGDKIYHKIYEKKISEDINKEFDEITVEYYYTKNEIYFLDNNVWKTEEFKSKNYLKKYSLKSDYFVSFEYDKEIGSQGVLTGIIKDENINDVFNSETHFNSANISIVVDKNFNIQTCNITAKTLQDRDVAISNVFTYNKEIVEVPI